MKTCPYSIEREEILAKAIGPLAAELRLLDAVDLISLLRFEYHSTIADLVDSAAELYFHPGTVRFGVGGDYVLDWDSYPSITLDLEITPPGVTIYSRLKLEADKASLSINYINFHDPSADPRENTSILAESLRKITFHDTKANAALELSSQAHY
jgi:hypothetical protein